VKLQDLRSAYYEFSGKASDIARTLALSAIAIVWIFKVEGKDGSLRFARPLVIGAGGAVLALSLDLLQYVWGALLWGGWARLKERRGTRRDEEFRAPAWFNWPGLVFFWGKLAAILASYVVLLEYLAGKLRET
jgi:hypothetical protein